MRALILVPHPDDEINVAGSTIIRLIRSGAEVFVAYSTNGDFDRTEELRAEEALEALKILGVDEPTKSPAAHVETYAPKNFRPWRQSEYTRKNFFADLESLIVELRADIIFCVDFDFHADHRALALAFDKVMSSILRRSDYRPTVYKKLAYATAFTAPQDFLSDNLLSTPRPTIGLEAYDFDLIGKFNYVWSDRIRLPVPDDCREPSLRKNPIARAVFAHRSQRIQKNALAIINADEVFFERRTDSITFDAEVRATSGDPIKVCDFQFLDVEDINASPPTFANYYWAPTPDDSERRLTFEWAEPQTVRRIKIYGTLNGAIDKLRITFDNMMVIDDIAIELGGAPTTIDLVRPIETARMDFEMLRSSGDAGISEIEIFTSKRAPAVLPPFIKIVGGDQFIFDFVMPSVIEQIDVGLYRFGFDGGIDWSVEGGSIETRDGDRIAIKLIDKVITVRAEGAGMSDAITIRREGLIYFLRLRLKRLLERIYLHWSRHWTLRRH